MNKDCKPIAVVIYSHLMNEADLVRRESSEIEISKSTRMASFGRSARRMAMGRRLVFGSVAVAAMSVRDFEESNFAPHAPQVVMESVPARSNAIGDVLDAQQQEGLNAAVYKVRRSPFSLTFFLF